MRTGMELFGGNDIKDKSFAEVLSEVQGYVAAMHSDLIAQPGSLEAAAQIKKYIRQFLYDEKLSVSGMDTEELTDAIFTEMAEFSFLTKYIYGTGVEEIDINSWQDIEVQFSDGRNVKLDERFDSPEHAVNVLRRMLHLSGIVIDNASPAVLGSIGKNIRIAAMKYPLVDEDVGISASIRIVNPQNMTKDDFLYSETATEEMLDFLSACIKYGVSVCIAGATSSGKTTLAGWLLTTIPDDKRIFTIESGSRELSLVREKNGRITNSVVHTITRPSENSNMDVSQEDLLDMALRFNPEIICVGEMRSSEAYAAQESARTGHTVLTTIHSNSCEATYGRMVTLCKRVSDMSDEALMKLVTEAFPIIVFAKQLDDKKRKVMEIMECEICRDGTRQYHSLFRYDIKENKRVDDRSVIVGEHVRGDSISDSLKRRFISNGMSGTELTRLCRKEEKQNDNT